MDCTREKVEIPEISARLRERVAVLADEPSSLIDRCYGEVLRIGEYADLSRSAREDVRDVIGLFVGRWCGSMLEQPSLTHADLEDFGVWVRRRVHQGISLNSILRALRRAIEQLWLAHLALVAHDRPLGDELLFVLSPYLLRFSESMNQLIERVFLDERFKDSRWRDELRCKLGDLLFDERRRSAVLQHRAWPRFRFDHALHGSRRRLRHGRAVGNHQGRPAAERYW
ncbi:hypothetical protein QYH69_27415 [Paraburkholderia sp. SARCC-3016]|uniref:hypothetical protein n=1 Tax=Paraburkholderia sp. SARCC-3016 TaxID=3058611 RepID=UPI002806D6DE|nr:hypothetical protein [Paraburkholderia sp. SARCC-3016]MDQ7980970.1 hypothetical protein [Paraburkholderia sp. SARCC-3016]